MYIISVKFDDLAKQHYYYKQIVSYAKKHNYYFNRTLPKSYFKFVVAFEGKRYELGITLHHFGYDDSVIAIGAFLEYKGILPSEDIDTTIPLDIKPLVISSKGILPSEDIDTTIPLDIKPLVISSKGILPNEDIDTTIPLDIKPLVISIKDDIAPKEKNIGLHLEDILTATIAQIASEI